MGKVKALTGEGWGLEVGEGHHLQGSLGQLVSSNISIHYWCKVWSRWTLSIAKCYVSFKC